MFLKVYIHRPAKMLGDANEYFRAAVTPRWISRNNNGRLESCGLTIGEDINERQFKALMDRGRVARVTFDEWNHSGCKSSCVTRGGKVCSW